MIDSLFTRMPNAQVWVLAMDEVLENYLTAKASNNIHVISLKEVEAEDVLAIKMTRSKGEYCWTLTSVFTDWLLSNHPDLKRVTYVDADLFFLNSPMRILNGFLAAGRDVLITEHAYDPKYDQTETSGRFCVQFMTFNNNPGGRKVLSWWRERCLEWCFARFEDGKFGDQKYLDQWPVLFEKEVWILPEVHLALAPWNLNYFVSLNPEAIGIAVFFHFHGFRFSSPNAVRTHAGYFLPRSAQEGLYANYVDCIFRKKRELSRDFDEEPPLPFLGKMSLTEHIKSLIKRWRGLEKVVYEHASTGLAKL